MVHYHEASRFVWRDFSHFSLIQDTLVIFIVFLLFNYLSCLFKFSLLLQQLLPLCLGQMTMRENFTFEVLVVNVWLRKIFNSDVICDLGL